MLRRIVTAISIVALLTLGIQAPAQATSYDYSVTGSATANSTTVPSVITWNIEISSVGDDMGEFAAQEGYVEFTAPSTISLVISNDCDTDGNDVTCYWIVSDTMGASFEVHGLVSLLAIGTISITPTITYNSPRTDDVSSNDATTISCTAVTSALVTCP